jgi:hypothetical protein
VALEAVLADQQRHRLDRAAWVCVTSPPPAYNIENEESGAKASGAVAGQDEAGSSEEEARPATEHPPGQERAPPGSTGHLGLMPDLEPTQTASRLECHVARLQRIFTAYPKLRAGVAKLIGIKVDDLEVVLQGRMDFAETTWARIFRFLEKKSTPRPRRPTPSRGASNP